MAKAHQSRAWRTLRDQVVREEPRCWLQLDGCTGRSQTGDHIITVKARPDLALVRSNVRGVCHHCNRKRNDTPIEDIMPSIALSFFD